MFPGMVSFRRKRCTEPVPPVPAADTAKTPVQQKETAGDAGGSDDADGDGDLKPAAVDIPAQFALCVNSCELLLLLLLMLLLLCV